MYQLAGSIQRVMFIMIEVPTRCSSQRVSPFFASTSNRLRVRVSPFFASTSNRRFTVDADPMHRQERHRHTATLPAQTRATSHGQRATCHRKRRRLYPPRTRPAVYSVVCATSSVWWQSSWLEYCSVFSGVCTYQERLVRGEASPQP